MWVSLRGRKRFVMCKTSKDRPWKCHQGIQVSGGTAPLILNRGSSWKCVVNFTPQPLLQYPLNGLLGGPQRRSEKISTLPGFEPRIIQMHQILTLHTNGHWQTDLAICTCVVRVGKTYTTITSMDLLRHSHPLVPTHRPVRGHFPHPTLSPNIHTPSSLPCSNIRILSAVRPHVCQLLPPALAYQKDPKDIEYNFELFSLAK